MKVKPGASIEGCRSEILVAAITIIGPIFNQYGKEAVITSGTEKCKHSAKRSAHYNGNALDFRHRWFSMDMKQMLVTDLQLKLGAHFVVVLEYTHIHIHYAPVYEA